MNGIRNAKTVGTEQHTYLTQNGQVVREKIGTGSSAVILDFIYDNNGSPFALNYSNNNGSSFTTFYYILNMQGDVVRLVNAYGTTYASYEYDAWGNILSQQSYNSNYPYLHSVNPLRYRGYYFDKETGWYYLQSRYYDPEIGRFINTDLPEYSAACSIRDTNLFMYCHNSPVIYADRNGYDACLVINSDGAHNYGHLSLFVQDNDGCWFYYSFASIENKWKTAIWAAFDNPVEGRVTGVEVGFSDRADLYSFSGFQSFVASTGAVPETAEKTDTTIYIKGNFSKTQQRCANDTGIMCYHAVTFNCMHYAIQRLRVSNQLTKYQQNALKEAYSKYYSPNAARSTLLRLQNVPTIVRNRGGLRRELK